MRSSAGRQGRIVQRVFLYLLMALLAVPFVYPMLWMIFASFKPNAELFAFPPRLLPQHWTWQGFGRLTESNPFFQQYFNSLYIAVLTTVGTIAVAALAGYAFARIRFAGANKLFVVIMCTIFLPAEVTIIPIFQWMNRLGLLDTHIPLIVVPIFGPAAVTATFLFRQFFLTLPKELEEAAALDGIGRLGTFWRIALPLARPAIGAVAIMTFLRSFNMYFEPLIYLRSPQLLTVGVGLTRYQDNFGEPLFNTQLAATSLAVLPILIVFVLAQRQFVEGLSQTGLKG